jgi:hypothetical protein
MGWEGVSEGMLGAARASQGSGSVCESRDDPVLEDVERSGEARMASE